MSSSLVETKDTRTQVDLHGLRQCQKPWGSSVRTLPGRNRVFQQSERELPDGHSISCPLILVRAALQRHKLSSRQRKLLKGDSSLHPKRPALVSWPRVWQRCPSHRVFDHIRRVLPSVTGQQLGFFLQFATMLFTVFFSSPISCLAGVQSGRSGAVPLRARNSQNWTNCRCLKEPISLRLTADLSPNHLVRAICSAAKRIGLSQGWTCALFNNCFSPLLRSFDIAAMPGTTSARRSSPTLLRFVQAREGLRINLG